MKLFENPKSGVWCALKSRPDTSGCVAYSSVCDDEPQCANNLDEIDCPVLTEWADWSACSVTCDSGRTRRERYCEIGNSTFDCNGQTYQEEPCFLGDCSSNVTWSEWSECSGKISRHHSTGFRFTDFIYKFSDLWFRIPRAPKRMRRKYLLMPKWLQGKKSIQLSYCTFI